MNSERMHKVATSVLAVLLIGTNAWWLYHAIDHGVTLAYRDQVLYEAANRTSALAEVSSQLVRGKSKEEATSLLRMLFPAERPYEKDSALRVTWVALQLSANGTVLGVEKDPTLEHWAKPASTRNRAEAPPGKPTQ